MKIEQLTKIKNKDNSQECHRLNLKQKWYSIKALECVTEIRSF